jgi:sporulation protein YlmC with PRC-barrel domain
MMGGTKMDIPIGAAVECTDGPCGRSTYVILNPVTRNVTHLVVEENDLPHIERLVPVSMVQESTPEMIHLHCSQDDLGQLEHFIETHFVPADPVYIGSMYEAYQGHMMWPYVIPEDVTVPLDEEQVPPGELAVRRGAQIHATDGRIGHVDEFLVQPESGHITHLVLREGHFWGQKDVNIPVSEIKSIEEGDVYLKLDKASIEALPAIPIKRWWKR